MVVLAVRSGDSGFGDPVGAVGLCAATETKTHWTIKVTGFGGLVKPDRGGIANTTAKTANPPGTAAMICAVGFETPHCISYLVPKADAERQAR